MSQPEIARLLFSSDPKLRRMLGYWAATGLLYCLGIALLQIQVQAGTAMREWTNLLCWFCAGGVLAFFMLVRVSPTLGITPSQLAAMQAVFAIACDTGAYAVMGPVRGASLMVLLVVIVFCAFSLRPRATLALCAAALAAFGATMFLLAHYDPQRFPPAVEAIHFALVTCCVIAVSVLTGEMSKLRSRLKQQKEELLAAVGTIRTLATVDELTSLANRRHMNDMLQAEERRQSVQGQPLCIAVLDIDFFKRINDRYGHDGGDAVLRAFAAAARAELRADDVLARWGGEEFLLMLPNTEVREAARVLERMAGRVGAIRIGGLDVDLRITFSGGVVAREAAEPIADTIIRADKAMYEAKTTGRDRIVSG